MGSKSSISEFQDRFNHFLVNNQYRWLPIPGWIKFYLELGASLSSFHEEKFKYVTALALPTRSFAVNFIGSGFSLASTFQHTDEEEKHLQNVLSLPKGTPVKFLDKGKIKKAIIDEKINIFGKEHIGLIIEAKGNVTTYLEYSEANKIEFAINDNRHLPLHQRGRDIQPPSGLIQELFKELAFEFVFQTRVDGIVVGSSATLKNEAELKLGIKLTDSHTYSGFLHEMFRVSGFNPNSTGHRFLLQSTNNQEPIDLPSKLPVHSTVIFDGPLSFLKWKDFFSQHNWIVVLDHTAPNFQNAVNQLNQECSFRSTAKISLITPPIPSGMEMMVFGRDI